MKYIWPLSVALPSRKIGFTDRSKLSIIYGIYVSCLSYFLVCSLQPCKGWLLGFLVCYVLLCFCHFSVWCPGSGVVLE